MKPVDPDVLERNLERLFARAYEPVQPSEEFRARLRGALERGIARPARSSARSFWRVAAAILVLLGAAFAGWAAYRLSTAPSGPDEPSAETKTPPGPALLESGRVAPPIESAPSVASRESAASEAPPPAAPSGGTLRGTLVVPEGATLPETFVVTLLRGQRLPRVSMPEDHTFQCEPREFVLSGLEAGTWTVFVQVRGFAVWTARDLELAEGATLDLRPALDPGIRLRGRVVDADGRPVEGALVLAEEETPVQVLDLALVDAPATWIAAAKTDAQGAFELPHLVPGKKTLRATRAGFGAGWYDGIDTASIDPADPRGGVEIRLTRAGAIEGRVAHDDGAPWPGARVIVAFLDLSFQRPCMSFGTAVADADGRYAVEDLPPGGYVAFNASEAGARGGPSSPRILQARVEPGARARVDLPASLTGTAVEGRLVSGSGEPMAGYDVTIVPGGGDDEDWKAARSGEDGSFRFPDLAPGGYDVFVGEGLGVQFVLQERIEVPAVPVFRPTITAASGVLRGRVAAAGTGVGLAKSIVVVETDGEFAGKTQADAQGRYEFRLLRPGRYRVTAYAVSGVFGPECRADVDVPVEADVDFALEPGASLTIRVADAEGRPVRGARIRFTSESGATLALSADDATDANGLFRAPGVKPGRWTVLATHEPEGRGTTLVELAAGEERTVEIRLRQDR